MKLKETKNVKIKFVDMFTKNCPQLLNTTSFNFNLNWYREKTARNFVRVKKERLGQRKIYKNALINTSFGRWVLLNFCHAPISCKPHLIEWKFRQIGFEMVIFNNRLYIEFYASLVITTHVVCKNALCEELLAHTIWRTEL